jgi:hypothetical protein
MSRLRLLALLLLTSLAAPGMALPSVARADDPEPEVSDQVEPAADPMHLRWDRLLGVQLTGGADTPYGVIGAGVVVQPHRFIRLDVGGGGSRDGGRVAGGVAFTVPSDSLAFMLRIGFAGGPLTWNDGDQAPHIHRSWDFAAFFDASIALEYRFDMGLFVQLSFGVESTLNDHADHCTGTGPTAPTGLGAACAPFVADHPARLFAGLTIGYMFDFLP